MEYEVLLFYKYISVEDPKELADHIRTLAGTYELTGRAIVASEGINATFEGEVKKTELFLRAFLRDPRFCDMQIKKSKGEGNTFPKLSVKVRAEIVGTHLNPVEVNPLDKTGKRLSPQSLQDWYQNEKDFVVIDMRNTFEYASGHFKDSVDPGLRNSRELPLSLPKLEPYKNKTVVTVCTGGVRCEKMSSYLLQQGFSDVYQLEGGIHSYMEQYPEGAFKGALYTFDQRVTMDFGGKREVIGTCHICGESTEKYVNCANAECHLHFLACDLCRPDTEGVYCSKTCKIGVSAAL